MQNYTFLILLLIGVAIISLSLYPWQNKNKNTLEEVEFTILDNHTVELNTDDHIITRISWTKNKYNYVAGIFVQQMILLF